MICFLRQNDTQCVTVVQCITSLFENRSREFITGPVALLICSSRKFQAFKTKTLADGQNSVRWFVRQVRVGNYSRLLSSYDLISPVTLQWPFSDPSKDASDAPPNSHPAAAYWEVKRQASSDNIRGTWRWGCEFYTLNQTKDTMNQNDVLRYLRRLKIKSNQYDKKGVYFTL